MVHDALDAVAAGEAAAKVAPGTQRYRRRLRTFASSQGLGVLGFWGFGVQGFKGLGFRVSGLGFRV